MKGIDVDVLSKKAVIQYSIYLCIFILTVYIYK